MDKKVVKITPTEQVFAITWMIHKRCNNDCMYCGEDYHDDSSSMLSLDEFKSYWIQLYEKTRHMNMPYKIAITGGEPIINKDFKPFVEWLISNYGQHIQMIGAISNGTGSKKYYLELFKSLNYLTLSTHTESDSFNLERFCDTIIACNEYAKITPGKSFMVNMMEEYWAVDTIKHLADVCKQNDIKFNISKINWHRPGARTYPIFIKSRVKTPREDLPLSDEVVAESHKIVKDYLNLNTIPEDTNYNVDIEFDDGSSIKTYGTRLAYLNLHHFKGWKCYAGYHRIYVHHDLSVHVAECFNDTLGSLKDGSFAMTNAPTICKRDRCTSNISDLMIRKSKI